MTRVALSLLLVMFQVMSWNAAPLFRCLDGDGEVCIDFGPGLCGCCQKETCDEEECREHGHHEHSNLGSDNGHRLTFAAAPCGCTHVQISEEQAAVTSRVSDTDSPMHACWVLAVLPACEVQTHITFDHCAVTSAASFASDVLTLRAGVVLRC